jgi:hypothetical protein
MLLRHRHRFGGADVAAVVALDVQRVRCDRVTTREHDGICDASGVISLLEPARLAAAAERVDQATVPRAFNHRNLINAAVDGSRLDADLHRRFGFRVRNIHIINPRRHRAVCVERWTERAATLQLEFVGHADKRLLLRPREDRSGDWMVDDGQLG